MRRSSGDSNRSHRMKDKLNSKKTRKKGAGRRQKENQNCVPCRCPRCGPTTSSATDFQPARGEKLDITILEFKRINGDKREFLFRLAGDDKMWARLLTYFAGFATAMGVWIAGGGATPW